jgi:hypothetical protein
MKSNSGITNLVRNSFFEPSLVKSSESVINDCLKRIDCALKINKPAIIGGYRINFMGSLHKKKRTKHVQSSKLLLEKIIKKWPDVAFMSSDQLATLIGNE